MSRIVFRTCSKTHAGREAILQLLSADVRSQVIPEDYCNALQLYVERESSITIVPKLHAWFNHLKANS